MDQENRTQENEQRTRALEERVKIADKDLQETNAELRARIEQLSALHRISLVMRYSTTNPQQLWEMMLQEAVKLFNGDTGIIFLSDGNGKLKVQAATGKFAEEIEGLEISADTGVVGYVAQSGEPRVVEDVTAEPLYRPLIADVRSQVAAPMIGGESVIGVISVQSCRTEAFKSCDCELLMTLASHAARVWENAMLFQMAQQRNRQLLESYKKLRETQQELIKKERLAALGEMSAIVAHELRNPMTAIRGFAQRIGKRPHQSQSVQKYIDVIISEVDRLDEVIQSVLAFARKPVIQKQLAQVDTIIEDSLLILNEQIKQKKLSICKQIQPHLPGILLDADQMRHVMRNLLLNAIDVSPDEADVAIRVQQEDEHLLISIADAGPGVDDDVKNRIFEPFFTTKVRGTGLGLAMVQRIVDEHDGRIHVTNGDEGGAVFTVRLPLAGDSRKDQAEPSALT